LRNFNFNFGLGFLFERLSEGKDNEFY